MSTFDSQKNQSPNQSPNQLLRQEEFLINSEAEMESFAFRISMLLKKGDVLFLHGDLGVGKTTFTRGLLRSLGFKGRVKSPTFTLVEPYDLSESDEFVSRIHQEGSLSGEIFLYHYDLYRINLDSPEEIESLGFRDQSNQQDILVIEWPDRLGKIIEPTIEIFIDFPRDQETEGSKRKIRLHILREI